MGCRSFFFAAVLAMACGWFDARTPSEPSENNVPWRQPTQARYVVENLITTLEGLDLTLYGRCFDTQAFWFDADPALVQLDPARYENWTWSVEEAGTRRLFQTVEQYWGGADSAIVVSLGQEEWMLNEADSAMVQFDYAFTAHHGRAGVDSVASGTLRWSFHRAEVDRLWYLAAWWDFAVEGQPSWSAIKGAFRE
ncbi:hypothetical protein JXA88_15255 [Candidatus Fermentibacteria bacterium]|nr:hypothetical protein [Candidatus Fermentibacteria bacterium]